MRKLSVFLALVLVGLGVATGQAAASVSVFRVMLAPTATGDPDAGGVAVLRIDLDKQQV